MFGKKGTRYFALHSIRGNGKEFKAGHMFTEDEINEVGGEAEMHRLLERKAVTTNREEVTAKLELQAAIAKEFAATTVKK